MRIAYFDPFSGASGDMVLGALVDAGLSVDDLRGVLRGLDLDGYSIEAERVEQHGITGTRVTVEASEDQPARDWHVIRDLLTRSELPESVRGASLAIFGALAAAEALVHGADIEHVHFHEVGGVDAIVDIVGAAAGLYLLGVEQVYSGPPALGRGFARSQHGIIPVPAPATAQLLASTGAPSRDAEIEAELLTPTGAAILTTLAEFQRPEFTTSVVGYGFGRRELPWPNALRVWLGDLQEGNASVQAGSTSTSEELLLEANIDDMNPEFYELLMERLFDAGALDVFLTSITMKRGRPATRVSVIASV
ncbi:MAG: nickel pincer cofactor biosynthesis protein LarC, partial [Chloroflexota bacterium]|nr:nickel pincer cofactor biosynthesis protein LarC [Chloroflexota bacterium]